MKFRITHSTGGFDQSAGPELGMLRRPEAQVDQLDQQSVGMRREFPERNLRELPEHVEGPRLLGGVDGRTFLGAVVDAAVGGIEFAGEIKPNNVDEAFALDDSFPAERIQSIRRRGRSQWQSPVIDVRVQNIQSPLMRGPTSAVIDH